MGFFSGHQFLLDHFPHLDFVDMFLLAEVGCDLKLDLHEVGA